MRLMGLLKMLKTLHQNLKSDQTGCIEGTDDMSTDPSLWLILIPMKLVQACQAATWTFDRRGS